MSVLERAVADADGDIQAGVDALLEQADVSGAANLQTSHTESTRHLQFPPVDTVSQSDGTQRRISSDIIRPADSSQSILSQQSSDIAAAWGVPGNNVQPHLPNGDQAKLDPWAADQQFHRQQQQQQWQKLQQQQQQQQQRQTEQPLTFAAWQQSAPDPSPFAAAAAQPPPPPPKQAPQSPHLPQPVDLPATLEPQLGLSMGEFMPAGSAGLLSAKLGQLYMGNSSSGIRPLKSPNISVLLCHHS